MFRHCVRLQLRRGLHTRASASFNSQTFKRYGHPAYVVGASLTMATYLAWMWNSNPRHVSLDSEPIHDSQKRHLSKPEPSLLSEHVPSASATPEVTASIIATPSTEKTDADAVPSDAQGQGEIQEDSSGGQGAFNPETGEINWDCPCLGGMAHGPCGPQFREAFSCFVYSDKEPKGINCVEKFKAMQDCFRAHPDVYGEEIMDDDDENVEAPSESSLQPGDVPSSNSPPPKEQPAPASQTP
ncbi:hypothetical protein F5J12DRAFT_797161 [Pisolithus orientalis]|uniref:uncharacterized protein n=1 Tax=Pisolithus orientalis TaxID=936130 RepID=UPI002223F365|nr:uncharacterized protein F5J12DRAFT_797161 [Pisolithus orientalis]KAI6032896.1 hypothetical protein F5J12DRAFT_797161 [Pisolithus orientalis]